MTKFVQGQKGKLVDLGCAGAFQIVLNIAAQGMEVDIACFGLDAHDQLSDTGFRGFYWRRRNDASARF